MAKELSRRATGRTLYILDEPTTGLHFHDVAKLLEVIHELADAGNTVVVIEHNLEVIKTADWVIDMGPEGGDGGGKIVAEGTPEEVAKVKESYTGQFLRELLKRRGAGGEQERGGGVKKCAIRGYPKWFERRRPTSAYTTLFEDCGSRLKVDRCKARDSISIFSRSTG